MYSMTQVYVKRGEIVNLSEATYLKREDGLLKENEVANLKMLKSNIYYADLFLWKGIKLTKTVGEIEDVYTIENSPKKNKVAVDLYEDDVLNIKTMKVN